MRWQTDPVAKTDQPLLAQIGSDALDDRVPLATTLRKCIALGAQARNDELRDWAGKELDGYRDGDVPGYRTIYVPLKIDGLTFNGQVRGQQISTYELPDWAQGKITEELSLAKGVGDLQALVRSATSAGDKTVKLVPSGTSDLLMLWNQERQASGGGTIMALYWDVHIAGIEGVLDHIRTSLVRLVSEMRATMPDDASVPSPESAASAVNVVLHGGKRNQVTVTTAQADTGASASVTTPPPAPQEEGSWTKTIAIWTVIIAIIAGITLIVTLT
jgi:hypothetical protein